MSRSSSIEFPAPISAEDCDLEYGTRESEHIRRCMLANTWLHLHGELESDLGRQIKRDFKDCYFPDEREWKELVWERGKEVVGIAMERIGATP